MIAADAHIPITLVDAPDPRVRAAAYVLAASSGRAWGISAAPHERFRVEEVGREGEYPPVPRGWVSACPAQVGTRLSRAVGAAISRSTALRLLRLALLPPQILGVDDFALDHRHRCAT
ncbi:hypothetical protein [Embleya sp. NBC_00888]|uniref:hypothetical protein n=1 Tax=Embleya sp. NBC_00888 TaxID=2975960 RepID=UPI003867486D